jgi:pentatricopeptide repeat protein
MLPQQHLRRTLLRQARSRGFLASQAELHVVARSSDHRRRRCESRCFADQRYASSSISDAAAAAASTTTNAFWRDLDQAVREGNGVQAEEIVDGLLHGYEAEESQSQLQSQSQPQSQSQDYLETRIFSQVLEAWKNSESPDAAVRAQRLLEKMVALADQGILQNHPSLDDYHAVLECWNQSLDVRQSAEYTHDLLKHLTEQHQPTTNTYELVLSILGNGGHVESAQQLLEEIIRNERTTSTLAMYNYTLQAWANSSHPNAPTLAQRLLRQMQQAKHTGFTKPDGTSYNLVLQCWSKSRLEGAAERAEALLNQMKTANVRTTLASYNYVISALAQQGEAKRAEDLLTRLVKEYSAQFDAELKPTLEPFQSVLHAYSRSYHPDAAPRAESVLTHMQELYDSELMDTQPNVWSYNMVLRCWAHSKAPHAAQRAKDLFETMRNRGVAPETSSLNMVLNAWANRGDAVHTEELFWDCYERYVQDPLQNNPQPDSISFGTVLKAWVRSKRPEAPERADALLAKLQELHDAGWEQCKPDVVTYASVMQCHAKSKRRDAPEKAEALLRRIIRLANEGQPDMAPDTVCWNSAINAWAQRGNGERAEALFKEMLTNYIQDKQAAAPNLITFTAVLSAWAKTSNNAQAPERAELLLQRMGQLSQSGALDVKPNVISYSIVLDCLARSKTRSGAERAETILRHMASSDDKDVQPNVISYNSVIKAWSFTRDPEAVPRVTALLKEVLDQAEGNSRMTPNANTFGSVLKTVASSRLPDKEKRAQVVVDLMQKFGIEWSAWSRTQFKMCATDSGRGPRRRNQKKLEIPPVSELKYS